MTTNNQYPIVHNNVGDLNKTLIARWSYIAHEAIKKRNSFHVALAGGNTPKQLYHLLASHAPMLPWQQTHIYFGDERCVSPDHKDSNYLMASQAMLSHVPLPAKNIHRICAEMEDHSQAANDYQKIMKQHLPQDHDGVHFDLILLGLGPDGHIASLFPDTQILKLTEQLTAAVYVEKFDSWRISITYPVIEQAQHVILAAVGSSKADIICQLFTQTNNHYPVQKILKKIEWHLDRDAAEKLPTKLQTTKSEYYDQNSGC